ncbi:MAG: hypothetical protein JW718_09135 [Desulfovibrionaceae bacterium]|nr:hypothetical protein [Desulfovibrionaceae bacterium]
MPSRHLLTALAGLLALAWLVSTAFPGPAPAQAPTTLAVLPFNNNSVTEPEKYQALGQGLMAMLISDLKGADGGLKVIERAKITAILKEIALGQSGALDTATAVQAGRILGAQNIAFGDFMVLGRQVRIDARIVKVETSEVLMAESVTGSKNDFLSLLSKLGKSIAASLKVALSSGSEARGGMDGALLYSQALEALDAGDTARARTLLDKAVAEDPGLRSQASDLGL